MKITKHIEISTNINFFDNEFLQCPQCKSTMAKGFWAHGIKWWCNLGCGLVIHEDRRTNDNTKSSLLLR